MRCDHCGATVTGRIDEHMCSGEYTHTLRGFLTAAEHRAVAAQVRAMTAPLRVWTWDNCPMGLKKHIPIWDDADFVMHVPPSWTMVPFHFGDQDRTKTLWIPDEEDEFHGYVQVIYHA